MYVCIYMGNKKDRVWVLELFGSQDKSEILKVYEFCTMGDIAYVLNMKTTTLFNFYHNLIKARGVLEYVNIYPKNIVL